MNQLASKDALTNVTVQIFGREYGIKCRPHERRDLLEAVEFLDEQMRKTASTNRSVNTEQVAILTALNLVHQLLDVKEARKKALAHDALQERLQVLLNRLKTSLANFTEITV
jgi:cell division protein ZapA